MAPWILAVVSVGCGPTPEDLVQDLGDPERRETSRQELLLAKERAVEPLLAALDQSSSEASRGVLVEVLVSLMMRVEDERLSVRLADRLRTDDDPMLRARIARFAGMHRRAELAEALLEALEDEAGPVRYEALLALNGLETRLSEAQKARLEQRRPAFLDDPYPGVRAEALIRGARQVDELLREAERAVLEARLAEAESLYTHIVAAHPYSQRARYRESRYYYDSGQRSRGLQLLQEGGMLLDVPRLERAPVIDGVIGGDEWQEAARADSFFSYSHQHTAALPSQQKASMWVGFTDTGLFVGFRGQDDHIDSLVARFSDDASADTYEGGAVTLQTSIWTDDIVELFIDADFDHRDYAHMGINSLGVRADEWIRAPLSERFRMAEGADNWNDGDWRADDEVAAHVGDDHWSVEYLLRFGERFPRPQAGAVWGFNLVRVYRGQEYSQWVRTYASGHSPDDFGVLRFN